MYSLKYVQSFPDFVTVPRIRKNKYVVWNTFFLVILFWSFYHVPSISFFVYLGITTKWIKLFKNSYKISSNFLSKLI